MLRAFALLELVAHADAPATLETLTRASGLPKPTAYRILALLIRGGLVQREVLDKRYGIGPRTASLALAVQMRSPDRAARHAVLARLVEGIGETCNLTMPEGSEVVYLDRVETAAKVRLHMDIGSRVPMHCTASGKLFLAHLPAARVRRILGSGPLKRFTERTITSVAALERMSDLYGEFAGEAGDILTTIVTQLAEPDPYDLTDVDLAEYKGIIAPWNDWRAVEEQCRTLAAAILDA